MSGLIHYPLLAQAIALTRQGARREPDFIKTNSAAWKLELKAAAVDYAAIEEVLSELSEAPKDEQFGFWHWLERFVFLGGFEKLSEDFAVKLAERMVEKLPPDRRQALLRHLTDRKASYFFSGGRWISATSLAKNLPAEFVADWFVARFNAYGDDGAVVDLWRLVHELALEQAAFAFKVAHVPALAANVEGRKFELELLGGLRFRPDLPTALTAELDAVLESMRISPDAAVRANYWRTIKRPLAQGRLPNDELEKALASTTISPDEYNLGFELAKMGARAPTPKAQTVCLLRWLSDQLGQPVTPNQQYDTATAVWLAVEHVAPVDLGFDVTDLLLKIQPVDPAYRGIWQQIENALLSLSRLSKERFRRVLRTLAHQRTAVLLKLFEPNAPLHGILTRLSETPDETATFATELIASKIPGERRLGFYLTEELQLPDTKEPATTFTEEEFSVWIAEFRTNTIYKTMASQLLRAAARVDPQHTEMVHAFQEEVLFQCKNLPGLCLSQLNEKRTNVHLLEKPIADAETYFSELQKLVTSPIKAMQIPGLYPAIRRKRTKDRVKMEEAVAAHSVFEQFMKKSYLLYGTKWATFNGGVLGQEISLQSHSVATEFPRKVFIDPEGCLLMQFSAQGDLRRLKLDEEEPPA